MRIVAHLSTSGSVILFLALLDPCPALAAKAAAAPSASAPLRYTPGLKLDALNGRPDEEVIQFSNGRQVKLGTLRRLRAARLQQQPLTSDHVRTVFGIQPGVAQLQVRSGADLSTALQHPDSETIALPSGVRLTVAQLKFLKPYVEQRTGRSLSSLPQRPNLTGPAVRVAKGTSKQEWEALLQRPDNTILESPNGTRVTVGELKQGMQQRVGKGAAGSSKPSGTSRPATQPGKR